MLMFRHQVAHLTLLAFAFSTAQASQLGNFGCRDDNEWTPGMNFIDDQEHEPITQGISFIQIDLEVENDQSTPSMGKGVMHLGEPELEGRQHISSAEQLPWKPGLAQDVAILPASLPYASLLQHTRQLLAGQLSLKSPYSVDPVMVLVLAVVILAAPAMAVFCLAAVMSKMKMEDEKNPNAQSIFEKLRDNQMPQRMRMRSSSESSASSAAVPPQLGMRPVQYSVQSELLSTPETNNGMAPLKSQSADLYGDYTSPLHWPDTDESLSLPVTSIAPICEEFHMPQHEARFMVPVETMQTWCREGGQLGILGSLQYPLLYARIAQRSDGIFLELAPTPDFDFVGPVASVGPMHMPGTSVLTVAGKGGQRYGSFVRCKVGFELRREGQPALQVLPCDPGTSHIIKIRLSSGESFATVEAASLHARFSDAALVLSCNPGSDGVLVALISLA